MAQKELFTKLELSLFDNYNNSRLAFAGLSYEDYLYQMYLAECKKGKNGKSNQVHCLYMYEKWSN